MSCVVSIIVPIYNAEKYITRCIDSIICQTYPNWQLILIDDGSTDQTSVLCSSYSSDHRIFYRYKTNSGVSASRNLGISLAIGDYLLFLDADDFLESKCLETCIEYLVTNSLDVLQFGHKIITADCRTIKNVGYSFGPVDNISYICSGYIQKNVWCTIAKTAIIQENSLLFDETIRLAEDQLFVLDVLQQSKRVQQIPVPLYNYVQLPTSSAHRLNTDDTLMSVRQIGAYRCIPELDNYLNTLLVQMTIDYLAQKDSSVKKVLPAFQGRRFTTENPYGFRYRMISKLLSINVSFTLLMLKVYGRIKFLIYSSGRPY